MDTHHRSIETWIPLEKVLTLIGDLIDACKIALKALEHDVPGSCWAQGPLTGDPIEDLVVCPGCQAIHRIKETLEKAGVQK